MPAESEVCKRWGVSRVTARRALALLESDGLISTIPGRGRFVSSGSGNEKRPEGKAENIAAEIRRDIESGRLIDGDWLESEIALAARYGVAKGTAQAALAILDGEGLTRAVAGRGRHVTSTAQPKLGTRADQIASALEADIRSGRVSQGERIPGEFSLAERFGAGRGTIRRALKLLEEAGLLSKVAGGPRVVSAPSRKAKE
jgi:DNA-binding GntR family transcriptional regulator